MEQYGTSDGLIGKFIPNLGAVSAVPKAEPSSTGNHTVSTKNTRRNGISTDPSDRAG